MNSTLFKRQLIFTILLTLAFVVIALIAAFLASQFDREKFGSRPAAFYANMIDEIVAQQKVSPRDALAILQKANSNSLPFSMNLVVEPPPGPPTGMMPRPKRVGSHETHSLAVPLKSDPEMYLVLDFVGHKGWLSPRERILLYNFIALVIAVIFASAISLFYLFYSMRSKARLAAQIINEIKCGNMKARFPIGRADEVGALMIEFNKMADDIEGLIQQLKAKEQSRMTLLKELAHDLRTPVASLKNLLETLHDRGENLNPTVRDELTSLSLKEADYFGRLIEDLLVWAQVSEPTYFAASAAQNDVNLTAIIEEEIDSAQVSLPSATKSLTMIRDLDPNPIHLRADPHLMRRLLRNAFGNALSFAKTTVTISAHSNPSEIVILVRDDGPGVSTEALKNFGDKRTTRSFSGQMQDGRLSLGLGSLIMKSIAQLHRGQIEISNTAHNDASTGAVLVIRLPKSY